ncbi:MAG TPA: amino acid adenylation domain-containing protein [Dongiaceae bacterium]|nr:amino acid adenylation domain-containing protein [Dongiaceae bacterium]
MSADGLPELLRDAAQSFPARDALVMEGRRLTWSELERASGRFACSLAAHGVGRGDRVGLWVPKSPEAIVALWGVLRAGAAYVPVDPGAPAARLAAIARDGGLAGLVTRADRADTMAAAFADGAPMRALWMTGADGPATVAGMPVVTAAEIEAAPEKTLPDPRPGDLAYVLYTSGSTGEPKGVAHTHASALAFVEWAAAMFGLTEEDRVSHHAPFHFDLSTFDLFASARAGAAVYPVPPRAAAFPAAIARLYAEARLTVWYETPSSLSLMLHRGGLGDHDLSALRVLLFAGEVMPPRLLRELMALAPTARYANLYGPTETNVCTWYEPSGPPDEDTPLPIGRACSGDQTHVLDERLSPVARGAEGELWVSGASVMLGYWNRPERTAETLREIGTPAGPVLAYRTGDRVREQADGVLEFLGRRDSQIKTRGYRVELGEVETALAAHPAVAEAVVLAVPDPEIGHRLTALVVTADDAQVSATGLREHCASLLPRYMVPETIRFRDALPRTSSGKIDRRALDNPDA